MPIRGKRGMIRDIQRARTGVARRIKIHIATEATNPNVAPDSAYVDAPSPTTDTIIPATGYFRQARVTDEFEVFGKDVTRKCVLETHIRYQPYLRKAYAVEVLGESGRFKIAAVLNDSARTICKVFMQGMD